MSHTTAGRIVTSRAQAQDTTTLYWNRQGAVCCGAHAPYRYSDTWVNEGWTRIPAGTKYHPMSVRLMRLTCETCRAAIAQDRGEG